MTDSNSTEFDLSMFDSHMTEQPTGGFDLSMFDAASGPVAESPEVNTSFAGDVVDLLQGGAAEGLGGVLDFIGADSAAQSLYDIAEEQHKTLTPETRESMGKDLFSEEGEYYLGEGAGDIRNWAAKTLNVFGMMATPVPGGALVSGGVKLATGLTKAANVLAKTEKVINEAAKLGVSPKRLAKDIVAKDNKFKDYLATTVGYGGMEGATSAGLTEKQIRENVLGMDQATLEASEPYQEALAQTGDQQSARQLVADTLSKEGAWKTFFPTAILGAGAGRFYDDLFRGAGTGSRVKNALAGGATEAMEEMPQGLAESVAQNTTLQQVDPTIGTFDNAIPNMLEGGTLGFGTGAGFGLLSPRGEAVKRARIDQAGKDALAKGGDALDAEIAKSKEAVNLASAGDFGPTRGLLQAGSRQQIIDETPIDLTPGAVVTPEIRAQMNQAELDRNDVLRAEAYKAAGIATPDEYNSRHRLRTDVAGSGQTVPMPQGSEFPHPGIVRPNKQRASRNFELQIEGRQAVAEDNEKRYARIMALGGPRTDQSRAFVQWFERENGITKDAPEILISQTGGQSRSTGGRSVYSGLREPAPVNQIPPAADTGPQPGASGLPVQATTEGAEYLRHVIPNGLEDARIKRPVYRNGIARLAGDLTEGGGVATVMNDRGKVVSRTASTNPDWFQNMELEGEMKGGYPTYFKPSVGQVKRAVEKALRGEALGLRQAAIIRVLMDVVTGERTDPGRNSDPLEAARMTREQSRNVRNFGREFPPNDAFTDTDYLEPYSEQEYQDTLQSMDDMEKALHLQLRELSDADIEALLSANPLATTPELYEAAQNAANTKKQGAGRGESEQGTQAATDRAAEAEARAGPEGAEEYGLEGQTPEEIAQQEADRKAEEDRPKEPEGDPSLVQSGDELFANGGQLEPDLFDANTPADRPRAETVTAPSEEARPAAQVKESEETLTKPEGKEKEAADEAQGPIEAYGDETLDLRRMQDKTPSLQKDLSEDDIASMPLSKIWPKKEVDAIEDDGVAAFATAARSEIPNKPRKGYKLKRWVEQVKTLRGLTSRYMEDQEGVRKRMMETPALRDFAQKVDLLTQIGREHWSRVEGVAAYPDAYRYGENDERIPSPHVSVIIDGKRQQIDGVKSVNEGIDQIRQLLQDTTPDKSVNMKFTVRGREGSYFIHKEGDPEYRKLATFTTSQEALRYRREHPDKLADEWAKVKARDNVKKADVRSKENRPRTGADHRQGQDVTVEQFHNDFGLRHVDWGKWVKDDGSRQKALNEAYDAFADLVDIVGIPHKAIGLNSDLIITFGKRGHGSAAAHFEAGGQIINLTKTKGAGSLAHEWFHALDNYFQRQRGEPKGKNREDHFVTYRPERLFVHKDYPHHPGLTKAKLEERRKSNPKSGYFAESNWIPDPNHPEGIRPEVEARFAELVNVLDQSPMKERASKIDKGKAEGYWSRILERAARSFENYVIAKMQKDGYHNDYLANVTRVEEFARDPGRYPYLLESEMEPVEAAFDNLFGEIKTKETDKGVALLSLGTGKNFSPVSLSTARSVVDRIIAANKKRWNVSIDLAPTFDALPDEVKQAVAKYGKDTKGKGVLHKGTVYVVADLHESAADIETTILHEVTGHVGVRRLYGKDIVRSLNRLYASIGGRKGLTEIAKKRGIAKDLAEYAEMLGQSEFTDDVRVQIMMEEALAHLAESPKFGDRVKAIVGSIRQWLRDRGFAKLAEYGETDLLHILAQGRKQLKRIKAESGETVLMVGTINDSWKSGLEVSLGSSVSEAANTWLEMAKNDAVFSYPRSEAKDFAAIMADVAPDKIIEEQDVRSADITSAWKVWPKSRNGFGYVIEYPDGNVQVSLKHYQPGESGSEIYAAAGNYAHNNGLKFSADIHGVGRTGNVRRIENLISLALKFRTTDFIQPFGKKADQWVEGDTAHNLQLMMEESYANAIEQYPDIKGYRFDPETNRITPRPVERQEMGGSEQEGKTRDSGNGKRNGPGLGRTKRRAIITGYLLGRGGESGAGSVLLENSQIGDFAGSLYSRERGEGAAGAKLNPEYAIFGMPVDEIEATIGPITRAWTNAPDVVVAETMDDPRIPEAVRADNRRQMSQGATGDVEGFIHNGTVYLVAENLRSPKDAVRVLLHEAVGHAGLQVFGKRLERILDQIAKARPDEVAAKAEEYGLDMNTLKARRMAAEEVLAEMAQTRPDISFVRQAVAAIRAWLRQHVPGFKDMKLTDDEIIQQFLIPARDFIESGRKTKGDSAKAFGVPDVAYSKDDKAWLVDTNGSGDNLTKNNPTPESEDLITDPSKVYIVLHHERNGDSEMRIDSGRIVYHIFGFSSPAQVSAWVRDPISRELDRIFSPLPENQFIRSATSSKDAEYVELGTHRGSQNHSADDADFENFYDEKSGEWLPGLSVAKRAEFPTDYMYIVEGEEVGVGTDQEPLIDVRTARVVRKFKSSNEYYDWYKREQKKHLNNLGISIDEYRNLVVRVPFEIISPDQSQRTDGAGSNDTFTKVGPDIRYSRGAAADGRVDGAAGFSQDAITNTPAFKRWFGDSKVVDEEGRPLVVYHGTDVDIKEFDKNRLGFTTGAKSAKGGFFFGSTPDIADSYPQYDLALLNEYAGFIVKKPNADNYKSTEAYKKYVAADKAAWEAVKERDNFSGNEREAYQKTVVDPLLEKAKRLQKAYRDTAEYKQYKAAVDAAKNKAEQDNLFARATAAHNEYMTAVDKHGNDIIEDEHYDALVDNNLPPRIEEKITHAVGTQAYGAAYDRLLSEYISGITGDEAAAIIRDAKKKRDPLMKEADRVNFLIRWSKQAAGQVFADDVVEAKKESPAPNIMPVYLAITNPLVNDFKGAEYRDVSYAELVERARKDGKNGLILKNTKDPLPGDIYVAFEPEQIKSSIGNTGDFDGGNPDTRFSRSTQAVGDSAGEVSEAENRSIWDTINNRLDPIRYQMQDKLIDLKRKQQEIEKDPDASPITDASNPYQKAAIWEGRADERLNAFDEEHVQPLLEQVAKSGKTIAEVGEWLVARHAEEANAYLAEINPDKPDAERYRMSGMSNEEAKAILDANRDNAALQEVGEMIDAINRQRVEDLIAEGLITQEDADAWQGRYQHYVPLKREEAEETHSLPGRGQGFQIKGKESKRRTGAAFLDAANVIANTLGQYENTVVRTEKNRVGKALLELAESNPDESFWEVVTERKQTVVRNGKVQEQVRVQDRDNELTVKRNGTEHTIIFNPANKKAVRLANAMKNLSVAEMNSVFGVMAKINRFLSSINTTYNPEFVISNFARDIQTAGYNLANTELSGIEMKVLKSVPKALNGIRSALFGKGDAEWSPIWEDFKKQGGKTGWLDLHNDVKVAEHNLQKSVDRLKAGKATKTKMRQLLDAVDSANTVVENGVRLAAYKHAIDAGLTKEKAAALAKDLTVNFNRRGMAGPVMNSLYMFYNASAQGSVRLMQAMIHSSKGRKLAVATVGFAFALDMLNRSLAGDDDDGENLYDALPDYIKDHNIIIMGEKEPLIKIPSPWGYNVLHVIGQAMGEAATGKRFNLLDAGARVAGAAADAFNPVGSATFLQTVSPTLLDPAVMIAENKNFAGIPLKPEHTYDSRVPKPEYQMHWSSTPEEYKKFTKMLNDLTGGNEVRPGVINWSPESVEMMVDYVTGGMGRFVTKAYGLGANAVRGTETKTDEIPFVRKLTGYDSDNGVKMRYYEWSKEVAYSKKAIKDLKGPDLLAERRRPESKLVPIYNATEKRLRALRKMRRNLVNANASEQRIEAIDQKIRDSMSQFNRAYARRVLSGQNE